MMFRTLALLIAGLGVAQAHDVITTNITFTKEISRLINKHCAVCHGENSSSGITLTRYGDEKQPGARAWAKAIKEEMLERRMPPWQAVKGFGEFKDDRGLTQEDLETIAAWVEGGAPEGDPKFLPQAPKPVAWLTPAMPKDTTQLNVGPNQKLDAAARVVAIRPKGLREGATLQIVAVRPDGSLEPLIWIYKYKAKYLRTYYYKSMLTLPAGTRIEMSPADAGTVALFTKNAVSAAR